MMDPCNMAVRIQVKAGHF